MANVVLKREHFSSVSFGPGTHIPIQDTLSDEVIVFADKSSDVMEIVRGGDSVFLTRTELIEISKLLA
jgi:hypothetical protein